MNIHQVRQTIGWIKRCLFVLSIAFSSALSLSPAPAVVAAPVTNPTVPAATVITVDTSADLTSDSQSRTCTYTSGVYVAAVDGCTLRRALLEASARPQADRPIAIQFNLAPNDPNADLEVSGTWTLPLTRQLLPLRTSSILDLNGQVTLDGATQSGGRTAGPKIIVQTNDNSLEVESENNLIRNLAFKGGGVIFLKEDGNTVENIWMGLSDDGASVVFRTPAQPMRMAGGGIHIASNDNIVRNNIITGAFARAIDIDGGDNNLIENNLIGTRANGTVPTVSSASQCLRSLGLDPQNWYGGWGIALSGSNNAVIGNRIAGLHIVQTQNSTPPLALEIFGANHTIRDNIIGLDSTDKKVGVCGQGIKIAGSGTQILDNTIVGSRTGFEDGEPTAILSNDSSPLFGAITVRGNLVEDGPGKIYDFGASIPAVLRTFQPAKITRIEGVTIEGTHGESSPCPGCLIDFYLDDDDAVGEALAYLGSAIADNNGDFSFTLSQPLASGEGLRTGSTTQSAGVIGNYLAGTTTKLSKLYLPMQALLIVGPVTGTVGSSYQFTITVDPPTATAPFNFAVSTTDFAPQSSNGNTTGGVIATYTWTTPGVKQLNVTVTNDLGSVSAAHPITLTASGTGSGNSVVYLPMIRQ
ncbi:MAG: hypothetical protein KF832_21410 [Caldilineaceae bacterium]|nr:hypothetical protein [Caldilineaceae bacterium]